MLKTWINKHLVRPIKRKGELKKVKEYNKLADDYREYYLDDLSLEVLDLRKKFNILRTNGVWDKPLFLDFFVNHNFSVIVRDFNDNSLVIVYENSQKYRDYLNFTIRLFEISKPNVKVISCLESDINKLSFDENSKIYVLGGKKFRDKIEGLLPKEKIWKCKYDVPLGIYGHQYLDVFSPVDDEVVIEAGAYDGRTALEFLKWGGDKIKKIYSFEADPQNWEKCEKNINEFGDSRVQLVKAGCYSSSGTLQISSEENSASSSITTDDNGNGISVVAIDEVVGTEKVTFIKMDIEGAEISALQGAKECIVRDRPRLAICVYHKKDDIYTIPKYILSLVPEYRFYLRHYMTCNWETVLYAECK